MYSDEIKIFASVQDINQGDLQKWFDKCADTANYRASRRRVSAYNAAEIIELIRDSKQGGYREKSGGGVGKHYGYNATTSQVGVAFWIDGLKRVHVTAYGERISVCCGGADIHNRFSRDWWSNIYPEKRSKWRLRQVQRVKASLERIGPAGQDDRVSIRNPKIVAVSKSGLIIVNDPEKVTIAQVVVRDSTTGLRHHLTVPPRFGRKESATWNKLGNADNRVKAAIAWTFQLKPSEYAPTIEA